MTSPSPFDIGASIQRVLAANPGLGSSPGLALGFAQSPDPQATAEVGSHAMNLSILQNVADQHAATSSEGHAGFWGTLGHVAHVAVRDVEHGAGTALGKAGVVVGSALTELNKPLAAVQHNYRYLRAVYDRHGVTAGTLELLGMAAGGVAGGLVGGVPGAVLGSEAVGTAERHAFYDGTDRLTQTHYTDQAGRDVSFGRDLANLANYVTGGHVQNDPGHFDAFDLISGVGDATFDIGMDPLLNAGKAKKATDLVGNARLGSLLGGDATAVGRRVSTGRLVGPQDSADDILRVYANRPEVARTFDKLAGMSGGEIATRLPRLAPLAKELGQANSPEAVARVFHDAATAQEYGFASQGLPKTGITRHYVLSPLNQKFYDAAESQVIDEQGNAVTGLNKLGRVYNAFQSYRPFVVDQNTLRLSAREFDPLNPLAHHAVAQLLRFSQSPRVVSKVMDDYVAGDLPTRVAIYKNGVVDMLRAAGLPSEHPIVTQLKNSLDVIGQGGSTDTYALDRFGKDLSEFKRPDGSTFKAGIFVNQQGKLAFPDFQAVRNEIRNNEGGWVKALGKADQWVADRYVTKIFKPLALLSLGFATRVSLAELIPGSLDLGGRKVIGSQLANVGRRLAPDAYSSEVTRHLDALGQEGEEALSKLAAETPVAAHAAQAPITRSGIDAHVQALGHDPLIDGEHEHVAATVASTLYDAAMGKPVLQAARGAIGRASLRLSHALVDDDFRDVAHMLVIGHDAHMLAPAVATGDHGVFLDEGPVEALTGSIYKTGSAVPPKMKVGDGFTTYKTDNAKYAPMWSANIREAGGDDGARVIAKSLLIHGDGHAAEAAAIDAHDRWLAGDLPEQYKGLIRVKENDPEFSAKKVEAVRALVTGEDGTVHRNILQAIADGKRVDLKDLESVPHLSRPIAVKGPALQPAAATSLFDRIVNGGFKRIIDPVINTLSREPIYVAAVTREYKYLKPLVDAGTLRADDALRIAETRAVPNMLPLIHNTKLRSQFSDVSRNIMPFYFAQEQAMRRYGSVALRDPTAFAKLLLIHHAMSDSGITKTDDEGKKYVALPGGGLLADWTTRGFKHIGIDVQVGIPAAFSGNLQSLKTVVPETQLPSLSPVVNVPLKMVEDAFPETTDVIAPLVGPIAENSGIWSQIIPNGTLRSLVEAGKGSDQSKSFLTAYNYAVANAVRTGKLTEDMNPVQKDQELHRIRNTARIMFLAKALLNATSPLSPQMNVGDLPLRVELNDTIKANGGDFAKGIDAFLKKHPDATPDTVFLSESKSGTPLPRSTAEVGQFLADHRDLVDKYGYAAAFLMPQSQGKYDPSTQAAELAIGLRGRKTPERFLESVFIAQGGDEYWSRRKEYTDLRDKLKSEGNTDALTKVQQAWRFWEDQYLAQHPTFAEDLRSGKREITARQALDELTTVFAKGLAPQSPQSTLVRGLLSDYNDYAQAYRQASALGDRTQTASLYNTWQGYLEFKKKKDAEATQVINSVFARLPRPIVDPEVATG